MGSVGRSGCNLEGYTPGAGSGRVPFAFHPNGPEKVPLAHRAERPYPLAMPRPPLLSPPLPPAWAALRFARGWNRPDPDLEETTETLSLPGVPSPIRALRIRPGGGRPRQGPPARDPGWVVLHGITVTGISHPSLLRFARALATAGGHVLVPEVRSWTDLDLRTEAIDGIIEGAILHLASDPRVLPGGVLLAGFSFGGPQALRVAGGGGGGMGTGAGGVGGALRGVLSWGGYASMEEAIRFQFTGEHGGGTRRRPDPYGRWVLGANHLTALSGCEKMGDVASGLRTLALRSGRHEFDDWDPGADALKSALREEVAPPHREIWDYFVTTAAVSLARARREAETPPDAVAFADAFAECVRRADPGLDPLPGIGTIPVPVRLLHGREDALIPWTETATLARLLRGRTPSVETTITGLFAHSGTEGMSDAPSPTAWGQVEEGARLFQALMGVFRLRG
jgi:dienelactone hydrolase